MPKNENIERFELSKKLKIIADYEKTKSTRKTAENFKCHFTTISKIVKKKATIFASRDEGRPQNTTTFRTLKYPTVDRFLWQWHNEARSRLIPTSLAIYQAKAAKFAVDTQLTGFTTSRGWALKFLKRHGISRKTVTGESGGVDENVVKIWTAERLPALLAQYDLNDVYNADEFGLWYRMLPNKTYAGRDDACKGAKESKLRLTVLIGANATGTDKLKPLVIGKSKNPRCFKNKKHLIPVTWRWNTAAWMTAEIFESWLNDLNDRMVVERRKILMLVDNAPVHPDIELSNVRVAFLPANTTSVTQACDAGIIKDVKAKFRIKLMEKVVAMMDSEATAVQLANCITVLDAVEWLNEAWKAVKSETIANCFQKVGIKKRAAVEIEISVSNDSDVMYKKFRQLMKKFFDTRSFAAAAVALDVNVAADADNKSAIDAFISCDDAIQVMEMHGSDWEEKLTRQVEAESEKNDAGADADDDDDAEIMEVVTVEAEPKVWLLHEINVTLDSFTYTMHSRHPELYAEFVSLRGKLRLKTPLDHTLVQTKVTEFFHRCNAH